MSSSEFQIFRQANNIILIGTLCSNELEPNKSGYLYAKKYDLNSGEELNSQELSIYGRNYKVDKVSMELLVYVAGEKIEKYKLSITDLSYLNLGEVSIDDFKKITNPSYISERKVQPYEASNGVRLNPEVGSSTLKYSDIPEVN